VVRERESRYLLYVLCGWASLWREVFLRLLLLESECGRWLCSGETLARRVESGGRNKVQVQMLGSLKRDHLDFRRFQKMGGQK